MTATPDAASDNAPYAATQDSCIAALNVRLADPRLLDSSDGIQFCADLRELSRSLDWCAAIDHSEVLAELYETAAASCPPTLASHMFSAVEAAAERYAKCFADDELASVHAALAVLCAQQHRSSTYLQLFTHTSSDFPPLMGAAMYFWNCSRVFARKRDWEPAAMYAALALLQEPDVSKWRTWVLYELIAFGETRELPRVVQLAEKCPLVGQLAAYFVTIDRATATELRGFCSTHESELRGLGLWSLAKRSCIAFDLKWLRRIGPSLDRVLWATLVPTLAPTSLDDLLAAGMDKHFYVTKDSDGLVLIEPKRPVHDNEKALRLLNETSELGEVQFKVR